MEKREAKTVTVSEAFSLLKSGQTIVTGMATGEPQEFYSEFSKVVMERQLDNLRIIGANPGKSWDCFTLPEMRGRVEFVIMFLTAAVRKLQGNGFISYCPQHLSKWARNICTDPRGVDIFWGTCSAPDPRGFVSLGLNNCYESEILRAAKKVILEVNPNMPMTFGSTSVALNEVDYFVPTSRAIATIVPAVASSVEHKIAEFVHDLIQDESTLQLGIGGIPNAVGAALMNKKNLGIHTEMINDAMMDLYKAGVVNGSRKTIWPRKLVGTFALGTQKLYDFLKDNPVVELHPAAIVNDPYRIGRNHRMVSLNTAVEVDLTGQVCSESIGHVELSGVGGAAETHIGAQMSDGGRAIIALPSTAKGNLISKITCTLQPGAKVSISRNDVDTIVTEYGVASLKGKSVTQRVLSLIEVAHPEHRERLKFEAKELGYL